jgi:hypothetical protein
VHTSLTDGAVGAEFLSLNASQSALANALWAGHPASLRPKLMVLKHSIAIRYCRTGDSTIYIFGEKTLQN